MSADLIHTLELAGGCIAFGMLVIRFSRRRKISFRYTTGWLMICALTFPNCIANSDNCRGRGVVVFAIDSQHLRKPAPS
ncbi:MAG: hypothetical protein RLZZ534_1328 [Actinomycetota bacterium]